MKEIVSLILALNKKELEWLCTSYKVNRIVKANKDKLQLLMAIRSKKIATDAEASLLLYNKAPTSTYRFLRNQLKRDLHNVLLMSTYSISGKTNFREALYQCRKLCAVGYSLYMRNALSAANATLHEALAIAEKYEFTQDALLINGLMQKIVPSDNKFKRYKKWKNRKVELLQKELLAFDTYYDITLPHTTKKNQESLFVSKKESLLSTLFQLSQETESPNITYFYYRSSINYELINQNFPEALIQSKKLLDLVIQNIGVYSQERMAIASLHIGICYLELKQYNNARTTSLETLKLTSENTINWLITLNLLFAVYIAERKLLEAKDILQKALKSKLVTTDAFQKAKWRYYEANLYFLQKDYKQCLQILSHYSEIAKDKTGWYMGFRLLELLCQMELADFEFVGIKLNSFKQFFKRNHSINLHRYRNVHKLLASLHTHQYDYAKTYNKHQALIVELERANGAFYRDPMAFELITVEKWLVDKLVGLPKKNSKQSI